MEIANIDLENVKCNLNNNIPNTSNIAQKYDEKNNVQMVFHNNPCSGKHKMKAMKQIVVAKRLNIQIAIYVILIGLFVFLSEFNLINDMAKMVDIINMDKTTIKNSIKTNGIFKHSPSMICTMFFNFM